jgi:hypothetical protein
MSQILNFSPLRPRRLSARIYNPNSLAQRRRGRGEAGTSVGGGIFLVSTMQFPFVDLLFRQQLCNDPLSLPSPRYAGRGWPQAGRGVRAKFSFERGAESRRRPR